MFISCLSRFSNPRSIHERPARPLPSTSFVRCLFFRSPREAKYEVMLRSKVLDPPAWDRATKQHEKRSARTYYQNQAKLQRRAYEDSTRRGRGRHVNGPMSAPGDRLEEILGND